MNATSHASVSLYAIRLQAAAPTGPASLVGRLEHVLSGRLHAFDCGEALLAFLAEEQSRAYSMVDEPAPVSESRGAASTGVGR